MKEHSAVHQRCPRADTEIRWDECPFAMGVGQAAIETNYKVAPMATDQLTRGDKSNTRAGLGRLSFSVLMVIFCVSASMIFAADAMSQSASTALVRLLQQTNLRY